MYLNVPVAQQPQNVGELEAAIKLENTNISNIMVGRALIGKI